MGDFAIILDENQKENDFCNNPFEVIITNLIYISHHLPHGVIDVGDET